MYSSFAMAILASAVVAAPGNMHQGLNKRYDDPKFGEYMSTFNKGPRTTAEYELRQGLYHDTDNFVGETNRKAAASTKKNPLRLKHNWLSDRTDEEKAALLGLRSEEQEARSKKLSKKKNKNKKNRKGRKLIQDAMDVDHAASNRMTPVKNQGGCGSCWAFASTSALEGSIAVKKDQPAVRLSEQQSVDCTLRNTNHAQFDKDYGCWGCEGCWMSNSWDLMKEQGVMTNAEYPYKSGNTGREYDCAHDYDNLYGYVSEYRQVSGSVDDMLEKLETHPLSIALDAGSRAFQQYDSGVLTFDDCGRNNYQLNHAVVVVGYTQSGNDDGDDNDNDNDDGNDNDDDDDTTPAPVGDCKVTKWWHSCESPVENRRLQDSAGNDNYFKVQNSWGTNWGDDGFILMEIRDSGNGTCGMYNVMEWVDGCEIGDAGCSAGR